MWKGRGLSLLGFGNSRSHDSGELWDVEGGWGVLTGAIAISIGDRLQGGWRTALLKIGLMPFKLALSIGDNLLLAFPKGEEIAIVDGHDDSGGW